MPIIIIVFIIIIVITNQTYLYIYSYIGKRRGERIERIEGEREGRGERMGLITTNLLCKIRTSGY